jgi:hypothetical protein
MAEIQDYIRLMRSPLPEVVWPLDAPVTIFVCCKWRGGISPSRRWAMVERDFEQHELHHNHYEGLYEERCIIFCAGIVEYTAAACQFCVVLSLGDL